jgi:Toprim domain-containing protein
VTSPEAAHDSFRSAHTLTPAALASFQQRLDDVLLARLEELRGWRPAVVRAAGAGFDGERIVLPYFDANFALRGIGRYAPNPATRRGRPKMLVDRGSRRDLFPPPEALPAEGRWTFVCEGESDALRLLSCGIIAVAIPGVRGWHSRHVERFAERRVAVVFDCDQPGRAAAAVVAADLASAASEVRVLDLNSSRDDGFDVTDFASLAVTKSDRDELRAYSARQGPTG